MNKAEIIKALTGKLKVDAEKAECVLNEILAVRIVPDAFRSAAEDKISEIANLDSKTASVAINEFVGIVTARPALFEEVVEGFATQAGIEDSCRSCDGCRNCKGKYALGMEVAAREM
jgi:hypothetical protein